jgi:hypothetical protein
VQPAPAPSIVHRIARGAGVYTAIIALIAMPLLWFAFTRLAIIADYDRGDVSIAAACAWCVDHGTWAPILALPALVHGILTARRRSRHPIVSMLLGTALLAVPAIVTLWCFLLLVIPLYQVRPV